MSLDLTRGKMLAPGAADPVVMRGPAGRIASAPGAFMPTSPGDAALRRLCEAFLATEDAARLAAIDRLRESGLSAHDIVTGVVPRLARLLGRRWAEDDLGFADVTIASARLQEIVRAFSRRTGAAPAPAARRMLLVVPRGEHHTLGAFVAAEEFRAHGCDVDVVVDGQPREIAGTLAQASYAMVGLSVSSRRTLASARELVDTIRASATRAAPIVLGGSIAASGSRLDRITGVDHVAPDTLSALAYCRSRGTVLERAHEAL